MRTLTLAAAALAVIGLAACGQDTIDENTGGASAEAGGVDAVDTGIATGGTDTGVAPGSSTPPPTAGETGGVAAGGPGQGTVSDPASSGMATDPATTGVATDSRNIERGIDQVGAQEPGAAGVDSASPSGTTPPN